MLATKMSTGVTAPVNLRIPLHKDNEAQKWGIHPGFEFQGRGLSGPTKMNDVLQSFFKKEKKGI